MYTQTHRKKVFLSYASVLAWFFILALIALPLYQRLISQLDLQNQKEAELHRETQKLQDLQDIRSKMQEVWGDISDKISVLSKEFSEIEVFEYLHNYTRTLSGSREMIVIRDMSFSAPELSDIGFQKTSVNLSLVVSSEETLFNLMRFLSEDGNEYKFFIPNFTYPLGEVQGNFSVQLPLVLYHR